MELKEQHRRQKISEKLQEEIGHKATSPKEQRVHAAATAILAGDKTVDVERSFGVQANEMQNYINRAFPDEGDRFKFLEDCAISNAILAQGHFMDNYKTMTPEGAARSFSLFAGQALAIRKARETQFQETPVNVQVLLNLEQTLNKIANA